MKKAFMKIYRIFVKWLKPKYQFIYSEDLPDVLNESTVYLIGEKDSLWQAAFICPCGCNSTIQLNLLKEARPNWSVRFDKNNKIILSPSIHKTTGCKSHFFLIKGNIEWVKAKKYW